MFVFLLAIFGLLFGSFLHVVVSRRMVGESYISGRSHCFSCAKKITWYDNIPVFSYALLRSKTRCCKQSIPIHYVLTEIIGLAFFGLLGVFFVTHQLPLTNIIFLFFATFVLLAVFVSDLVTMEISDWMSLWPAVFFFLFSLWFGFLTWSNMLLGVAVVAGFFLFQYLVSKGGWIGGGDIRLGVLMGVLLGWQLGLVALFLAYIVGAFVSLLLLSAKKKTLASEVPFGTYLSVATFVAMLWGEGIINWYVHLL